MNRFVLLVGAVVVCDYATAVAAGALRLPFYLDSWATSAGVMLGGPLVGVVGGTLYNALMACTVWARTDVVWAVSSILVAASTWGFVRAGWVDVLRPGWMVAAGVLTGVANGCLAFGIRHLVLAGSDTVDAIRMFRDALAVSLGSSSAADLVDGVTVEIADKTVCLITAAAVVLLLRDVRHTRRSARASASGERPRRSGTR